MGRLKNNTILFFLVIIIFACANKNHYSKKTNNYETVEINGWKRDSLGCLNVRNKKLSEDLLDKYYLRKNSFNDFKKVFGKPNKINKNKDEIILEYYFDSSCHKIYDESERDYCIAQYYFESDVLKNVLYMCY